MLKPLIILAFLLTTQLTFAQSYDKDIAAIKASRDSSNVAIAKHDIDGFSKYWLPDFQLTRGSGIIATGKENIINDWKELFKTNKTLVYVRTPTAIEVGDNGIMAWETGKWEAKNSYSNGGNYSAMWRKLDGVWKLQAELFVSLRKL